jgi:hypothetical protein
VIALKAGDGHNRQSEELGFCGEREAKELHRCTSVDQVDCVERPLVTAQAPVSRIRLDLG